MCGQGRGTAVAGLLPGAEGSRKVKIAFLVRDLCHMGGVVSATQNLAGALAERHEVEIVALRKVRDESYFPLDPRVKVRALTDMRPHSPVSDVDNPLSDKFPLIYPLNAGAKTPVVSRRGAAAAGVPRHHRRRRRRQLQPAQHDHAGAGPR